MIASASLTDQRSQGAPRAGRARWSRRLILVTMTGAVVIGIGWVTTSRALVAPITGDQVVKANTAVALALLGVALLLDPVGRLRRIRLAAAGAATGVGALTLVEWTSGWSFRIDEALVDDPWSLVGSPAGRPAPLIALVVALLGLAVLAWARFPRGRDLSLIAACSVAFATLFGHAFAVGSLVTMGDTYAVPLEASLLSALLATAAILSAPASELLRPILDDFAPTASLGRWAVAAAVAIPLAGGISFTAMVHVAAIDEHTAAWLVTVAATGSALVAVFLAIRGFNQMGIRLHTVINTIPEGVYETSFDGTLLLANDPLGRLLGYSDAADLVAKIDNVTALWVEPHLREALVAQIQSGQQEGTMDVELRRQDGSTFDAELSFQVVLDHRGPVGLRGTIRDVTTVRALQQRQEQTEERYRLSFHAGPLGRAVLDLSVDPPRFADVNGPLAGMLGYTTDELVRVDPRSLVRPSDLSVEDTLMQAALLDPDGSVEYDGERRHRDGTWVPIHLTGGIAHDDAGHPLYAMTTIEDLRPRLVSEERLERTQQMLEAVVDNAVAAVYMLDLDGRFTLLNQESERIIGVQRSEVIGRRRDEIPGFGADAYAHQRNDRFVLASGRSQTYEERFGEGEAERVFLTVKFPLTDTGGEVFGVGGVSTDITELRRLQGEADRAWAVTATRLAAAVEYRDEETGSHIERMAAYCELIADHLHDADLHPGRIRVAATLHDAGKIAIPDDILLKPDTLTAAERAVMEAHTTIGYQLLSGTGSAELDLAASIAYTHHERWDGTGYPRRLRGEAIPIEGRIAAIADVFDALTTDRVYRKAFDTEAAVDIMSEGSGTAFDPELLRLFFDHLDETAAIRRRTMNRLDLVLRDGRYDRPRAGLAPATPSPSQAS